MSTRPTHLLDVLAQAHHSLLIFKDDRSYGERVFSSQTLTREAEGIAHRLSEQGVRAGDDITLLLSQPLHILTCFWGCLMLGARPLIAPVEHDKLQRLLPILSPQITIVDQIMEQTSRTLFPSSFQLINLGTLRSSTRHTSWHQPASAHDLVFHVASFESALTPRLVSLSHHNVLSTLVQHVSATHITSQSVLVNWMPLSSTVSLCAGHLAALLQNAGHVLLSSYTFPDDPLLWLHTLHQHRATHAIASRAVTSLIYHHIRPNDLNDLDLSSLTSLWLGPEPLSSRDTYEFCHLLGRAYVKPSIMQTGYALPQGSLCLTSSGIDEPLCMIHLEREALSQGTLTLASAGSHAMPLLSMGRPVVGCSLRIMNVQGKKVPSLTPGEVWVSGPGLPLDDMSEDGWYRTDTIGFLHQENLYVLGQKNDQYTLLGHTLHADDIEAVIEHRFFSLNGPVAAISYTTQAQRTHILVVVSCTLDDEEERSNELLAMRTHLRQLLPEGCAEPEHLGIVPITSSDYPHMATHQAWRHTFRLLLADGALDLLLARHDLPLPAHTPRALVTPPPAKTSDALPSWLDVHLSATQIEQLTALLHAHDGSDSMTLSLRLDSTGALHAMLPSHKPADPPQKTTLIEFLNPPEPPEELTSEMGATSALLHASEPSQPSPSEPSEPSPASLEEDTQQLWVNEHPEHTDTPVSYKSTYPTRRMGGISPHMTTPISPIQAPFLLDFTHPTLGWLELSAPLPLTTPEPALHQAVQQMNLRHEAARVQLLAVEDGEPLQYMEESGGHPLEFHDLTDLSPTHVPARRSQILARFRATTHEPVYNRALIHWLVLREIDRATLYMRAHHAIVDERAAQDLIVETLERMRALEQMHQSGDAPQHEEPITTSLASHTARLIEAHHQLNAHQYWTTLFARPYRHISLRDATFPHEKRSIGALLERSKLSAHAAPHPMEALLLGAFAAFIASVHPSALNTLIVSVPHDWSAEDEEVRPIHALTSPLPVRVDVPDVSTLQDAPFFDFVEHVQRRLNESHVHALSPDYIARAANTSWLVASGTRFAFRWRTHQHHTHIRVHSDPLAAYSSPFLNELFLDAVEQPGGDVLLTLHVGEDVQLKHPTMQVITHLMGRLMARPSK